MSLNVPPMPSGGISIVCVYNDERVREECLDASVLRYQGPVDVDYIPIDNRAHEFKTAGAALNHGASLARNDLVVFVHQDVYLHSIDRLAEAGSALFAGGWSMLGASGMTSAGEVAGLMRDRTDLIGRSCLTPVDVETLDEVLFMVSRIELLNDPLTESPDLAWHAYAVEYATRLRTTGRRVGAVDLAITHNSLTINLDRLDVAHRVVGSMYPEQRPIHTTCGTIQARRFEWKDLPVVRDHRWRLRWLRNSITARRLFDRVSIGVVLSDIRHDVDLLSFGDAAPLHVINLDRTGMFANYSGEWLGLSRLGKPVKFTCVHSDHQLGACIDGLTDDANVLVAGLDEIGVQRLCEEGGRSWLVGVQSGPYWALMGPALQALPAEWSRPWAVPLGMSR